MKTPATDPELDRPTPLRLAPGSAARLPRRAGELRVLRGRVWLTRGAGSDDELLVAGDRLRLPLGADAVIESFDRGRPIEVVYGPTLPV